MNLKKHWNLLLKARQKPPVPDAFVAPALPDGVGPSDGMAMDSANIDLQAYGYANGAGCYQGFMGYPALAALTQIPEYRTPSEKLAQAMTRKWIKITSKSDDKNNSDRISAIQDAMTRHKVRELFRDCATYDGFFGRCHLFIDVGQIQGDELAQPLLMDPRKLGTGKLRGFKLVEPMYTYPFDYNSDNPLDVTFYTPQAWYVMATKVHRSRLLEFISRPVPNMLKPAYNFGGMSMSQLIKPYVDNWLKTRTSVGKIISNFSITALKTDMANMLIGAGGEDGEDLLARASLFNDMRDNQGLMLMDFDTEELVQVNTPLTTLDALQAQSQEHMASVANMPLPILTGITPTGLNASAEGDIDIFYDYVNSMQSALFQDNLTTIINVIQLDLDGVLDPDITFEFVHLGQQTETELAANRKADAETAAILVNQIGAISADEVREALSRNPESGYTGLVGQAQGIPVDDSDPANEVDDDA